MKESVISIRNKIEKIIYKYLVKRIFFLIDPETTHNMLVRIGKTLGTNAITRGLTASCFRYRNKKLEQDILGIHFGNTIGLSAGFDKNAHLTDILPAVGFGFEEIGSITAEPCAGNPKPRLWRLPKSQAIIVNYGLMNDGSKAIAQKLRKKNFKIPIATSIAKTNCLETADTNKGIEDYAKGFKEFTNIGDLFVVNISCPNAFGGQPFTDKKRLQKLLQRLDKIKTKKPVFLKISPDLSHKEMNDIIAVAKKHRIHGFILTNLSKKREHWKIPDKELPSKGSISGKAVEKMSNDLLAYTYKKTKGQFILVGCGGVFSAEDAYTKIKLGASLVQLITGMIFEGPQVISEINQGLVKLLKQDRYKNISEAVGSAYSKR